MKLTCLLRVLIGLYVITTISNGLFAQSPDASTVPPTAAGSEQPIVIRADNVTSIGDIYTGDGNAVVSSNGETLYADHITFDRDTRFATASGSARLYGTHSIYRGEHMTYNFITKAVTATTFTSQEFPKYISGKSVTTIEENHYRLFDAGLTTDDRVHPSFHFQASQVEYRPGEDVVMKNVVVYIGDVPVFYIPILVQSLKDDRPTYTFNIGESSQFGFFFYNDLNFVLDKNVKVTAQLDYREKRGIGYGINANYKPPNLTTNQSMLFNAYYTHDELYDPIDSNYPGQKFRGNYTPGGGTVYDGVNGPDRYRVNLQGNLPVGDDFDLLTNVGIWSDPYVTRDFFPGDYSGQQQPDDSGQISRYMPDFNLSLMIRARTNSFFESADRLPELDLDAKQQPIFGTPIQYSSQTSMVYFDRRFADASRFRNPLDDSFYAFNNPNYPITDYFNNDPALRYNIDQHNNYSAFRYDSYHEFSDPHQYFNFLSLTPHIGGRVTYYSNDNRDLSTDSNGVQTSVDPRVRLAGDVGLEGDFKVSKTWSDVRSAIFGINGLRHIMEPYFDAQYAPSPTVTPNEIRPFDARLISDQLQPINFPDYNSIDSIDKQAVVRMGVENKLDTKRDGSNATLIDWNSYLDADFDHNFSATSGHLFSDWFNNVTFNLHRNWSYSAQTALAVDGGYNEVIQGIYFSPDPSLTLGIGENYINHSPLFPDSNQAYLNAEYRFNEHWHFDTTEQFEAATGQFQSEQFVIHRDLEAWDTALTFQNQLEYQGVSNQTVYLSFTLKALPQRSLHTPSTSVSALGGGSGSTGSNSSALSGF